MKKQFALKLCLGLVALFTVFVVAGILSFAQPTATEVSSEAELRAALVNGGNIKITANFLVGDVNTGIAEPFLVEKDTVLDLNNNVIEIMLGEPDSLFTVKGASLTIDGMGSNGAFLGYNGGNGLFKVVGVEGKETSLTINGGQFYTRYAGESQNIIYPESVIVIETENNGITPTVTINGGYFSCQNDMFSFLGDIVSGDIENVTIQGGSFNVDPSAYLAEYYEAIREWDLYTVLEIAPEYSDKFQSFLDEDGKFALNYYQPEEGETLDPLFESLGMIDPELYFYTSTLDETDHSVYVSLCNPESGEILETHKVHFSFQYNPAIREIVKGIIENIPDNPLGMGYYFTVKDMELINYWSTMSEEREYTGSLMQYSGEFREFVNYRNFSLDPRMGWDTPYYTEYFGPGSFTHNGTVYGIKDIGVKAQHILYVPDNTPNTRQDLIAAAQARIDEYLGENNGVVVSYADTAEECYYRWTYKYFSWEWEQENPDMTYDEWKQSSYWNAVDDRDLELESGIEGITVNDDCFQVVINGVTHYLFIKADSDNMVSPICKTADASTNITVSANDTSLPLDTMIQVEKLTEGTEYEEIIELLNVEKNETFDIKLHSQSLDEYVTSLENGKFEVRIPLSSQWEDVENLEVYYVNENQQIETYDVTPTNDGWAVFETNHFSIYTLAEKRSVNPDNTDNTVNSGAAEGSQTTDTGTDTSNTATPSQPNPEQNPSTSDGSVSVMFGLMLLAVLGSATAWLLKRKSA